MSMRVTNTMQLMQSQRNLQASKSSLADLTNQASTGIKLNKPSDDPMGTANLLAIKRQQAQSTQYVRNANDGAAWLGTADSALSGIGNDMTRLRNLAIEAASGTNSDASLKSIADEMQAIKKDVLALANTQYQGRTVFAGTSDAGAAFNDTTYAFAGSSASVQRRIGPELTVQVDVNGGAVFGDGQDSVFAFIDDLSAAVTSGGDVTTRIGTLDQFADKITAAHATVGASQNRITSAKTLLDTQSNTLKQSRSDIESIDAADAILQLQSQSNAYQMALAVTAQSNTKTLMDYLS
ncbi:flagellar hook-associated protein FlgL [Curtobacterium citreum]